MAAEHLNPFWFVPMSNKAPPTLSLYDWGIVQPPGAKAGLPLLTGRIRLRLKTLTELHVAGEITTQGEARTLRMAQRRFYRRTAASGAKLPVIDASTLRGCIRSYIEALTNSVAAIYNVGHEGGVYRKKRGERHIGMWVGHPPDARSSQKLHEKFSEKEADRFLHGDRERQRVVNEPPHAFRRSALGTRDGADISALRVDPATVLFGLVSTEAKESKAGSGPVDVHALGGRVRFEDVWFSEDDLQAGCSLDVEGKSSLGAPNPRKSSWWYFKPERVRVRNATLSSGKVVQTAEFVGGQLRGRKIYFHQDPKVCHRWYREHWVVPGGRQNPLVEVATEVIGRGATSQAFHVHFERLPEALVRLLLAGLCPSRGVRHKLGALRAFGFGSIELAVEAVEVIGPQSLDLSAGSGWSRRVDLEAAAAGRAADGALVSTEPEVALTWPVGGAEQRLCDGMAWTRIRLVGTFPPDLARHPVFVYPPYRQGRELKSLQKGFAQPVATRDIDLRGDVSDGPTMGTILEKLEDKKIKEAIDIEYYQRRAGRAGRYAYLREVAGLPRER